MAKVKVNLKVPVEFFKEGKAYIAYSPVLDLSTSANSFEKVKSRFFEAVTIFFEELTKMGTLDEVLSELGWQKVSRKWFPPMSIGRDLTEVSVPLGN